MPCWRIRQQIRHAFPDHAHGTQSETNGTQSETKRTDQKRISGLIGAEARTDVLLYL